MSAGEIILSERKRSYLRETNHNKGGMLFFPWETLLEKGMRNDISWDYILIGMLRGDIDQL